MFAGAAFTDSADIKVKSEVVDTLTALGVVAGFEDGSFQPNGTVTRAQMAKMIYVLRTGKSDASAYNDDKTSFTDINGHWARGYIKYCQSLGIIAGKSNTKFDPNGNVTAQEAAKMLLVTLGYDASKVGLTGANWASKTNALADENGLLKDVNTSFTAACPRQYAAQLIYNTIFANTVILRDGEYTNMNALGTGKNATVGVKYMDLVEFDAGTLYTCKLVDGKDYYSITTKNTPQGGHGKVYTDASDLLGQNVTVLMKSTSKETTVYGIYADEDSKVLATGYVGALEQDGDKKVKLNGTSYKVEQTVGGTEDNEAKIVTYAQSNSKVQLSNADASLVDLAAKVDKTAQSIDENIAASTIKLIDNDGNGKVDAAVYTPAKVGKVNTVSKSAIAVTNGVGSVKFDDYDIYDGVKKNDYVAVVEDTYTSNDNGVVTKLDVTSGKVDGKRTNEVKINGTWYKVAGSAPSMSTGDSYDVAIVGGVVVFGEMTAASSKDVMTISGVKEDASHNYVLENEVGENDLYLKVKAYFADGTSSEIKITKIDGVKLKSLTNASGDAYTKIVSDTLKVANLYTYSKLSDGNYDVKLMDSTNDAGYDVVASGNYSKQKIGGKTLADDAVVFVIASDETKVLTGKQIKDWPDSTSATFSGMYAATESNGINYIKVAAITGSTTVPNADGDIKYGYMLANSYSAKVEGEDGTKTAFDVWTNEGAKTLYYDGNLGSTVASGSILAYKEDGKFITISDSFKPAANALYKNSSAKLWFDTVAITGFDYTAEGTLSVVKSNNTTEEKTLNKDCVFIAVNSKDEEGMEGGLEGVQFANPGKTNSAKYMANAVIVTINDPSDSDNGDVMAVIYDANDIDWNDGVAELGTVAP